MPKSLTYQILNQKSLDFDPLYARQMELLLIGGKEMLKNASLFIPRDNTVEGDQVYRQKLSYASYHNHIAEIVNGYKTDLFSHSLSVLPAPDATDPTTLGTTPDYPEFYREFAKDADMCEHSFNQVLSCVFERGVNQKVAYLGLDLPDPKTMDQALLKKEIQEVQLTLADEEKFGLSRVYTYDIPYACIINWQYDDFGKFKWCVLYECLLPQDDFRVLRDKKTYKYKIWFFNAVGQVAYECYQRDYLLTETPNDTDEFPMVDEGVVSFKRIPIKVLCIPDGLCIGHQAYPIAIENFRLRTQINFGESRVANEIPFYRQGNPFEEGGGIPEGPSEDEDRGNNAKRDMVNKGFLVGSANDELDFKGPSGEIYKILNEQLKDNVNELLRIHHLMASTIASKGTSNQQNKGAQSKQLDQDDKAKVLTEYAMILKNFAKEVYDDISDVREEDICWSTVGMDDFDNIDPADLLQETLNVQQIVQALPSKTFAKLKLSQLAMKQVKGVDTSTMDIIKSEIDQAVDDGQHLPVDHPDSPNFDKTQGNNANNQNNSSNSKTSGSQGGEQDQATDPVGETGHIAGYDGMHLQTGEHIDSSVVYDQLSEDYKDKDIQFVKHLPWTGPIEVPLNSIDFSNKDNWQAAQPEDQDHVDEFADKMKNDQYSKPIILVNNPSNDNKMMVVDGHHRALAALQNNQPVPAYIGQIGSTHGPWDALHSKQKGSKEESIQKEASKQVDKSEMAKGGKTK